LKLQDTRVEIGLIWNTASPTTCKEEKFNQFIRSPLKGTIFLTPRNNESESRFEQSFHFRICVFESPRCALSAYPLEGEIYYNYARTKFSSIFVKLFILF
ncbi:hypothetical protein Avbf_17818, partial [Armadillidium vulgare]